MALWQLNKHDTFVIGLFHDSAVCYHRDSRKLEALGLLAGGVLQFLQAHGAPAALSEVTASIFGDGANGEELEGVQTTLTALAAIGLVVPIDFAEQHASL